MRTSASARLVRFSFFRCLFIAKAYTLYQCNDSCSNPMNKTKKGVTHPKCASCGEEKCAACTMERNLRFDWHFELEFLSPFTASRSIWECVSQILVKISADSCYRFNNFCGSQCQCKMINSFPEYTACSRCQHERDYCCRIALAHQVSWNGFCR